jgi:hypothetical protein
MIDLRNKWLERLAEAGKQYDGHVTHGSLQKQVEVMDEMVKEVIGRFRHVASCCEAGGHKMRARMFRALAKEFETRYL